MANYSQRRQRRLYGGKIAIVAGILVALIGIYFIVGISRDTDRKNAECTEETVGTVTASQSSGTGYNTDIEYTPGYSPMTVTLKTKKQYDVGTEATVKYHPTSFTRVYIEGMSSTGKDNILFGVMSILGGIVLSALGVLLEKLPKKKRKRN